MIGFFIKTFRGYDAILFFTALVLVCIGLAAIYSVDLSRGEGLSFFSRQLLALGIGVGGMILLSRPHITFYEAHAKFIYVVALVLLISVLFFGTTIRGTTGWFRFLGFSFQPAEFAKLALVVFLAWRIDRQARQFQVWQFLLVMTVLAGILVGLIMLQPDLGSALVLMGIWFGMILLAGIPKRYTVGVIALGILVAVCSWMFLLKDYQKDRILTFVDPERDPLGSGYNVTQSIIAIGSGGIFGRGLGFGSQSQLHFLPEAQTDFIFSVIGEELGFVGVFLVLSLHGLLIFRLVLIGYRARGEFAAYVTLGIALLFLFQVCINVGAAIGLLPVTGVTLPLVSYGGSSLIANFLLLGIAESAARSSRRSLLT
jgi:rod shape determining protein RodA